jgi:hypothetical protein
MLGMAEVTDFSCLGVALRGMPDDPVAAVGDKLWVTLVADEGIIPLRATLVYVKRHGLYGVQVEAPSAPGQHFLLRLYGRVAASASATSPAATYDSNLPPLSE